MRTKTLALSAMFSALGTASLVAQANVYSINAVGYINVTLPVGYSIVACQLQTTNNTIAGLFNNLSPTPGQLAGCKVLKYNTAGSPTYFSDVAQSSSYNSTGWANNGTLTLNPGEAIWFDNGTGHLLTNTFVGTVPQGTMTVPLVTGFQMISSPVPFSGDLFTVAGLTNYVFPGTKVEAFQGNPGASPSGTGYNSYVATTSGGTGYLNQWSPGDPTLTVGEGFWYDSPAGATPWVQIFSINP
jgi:hypothetical protein